MFRRRQSLIRLAAITISASALSLSLAGVAVAADNTISIGILAPESTIVGQGILDAAELATNEVNASGGIDGHKIVLHKYNTQLSASAATLAFQRAVQQDGATAVVGVFTSEVALALIPWASRLKTPLMVTAAASDDISKRVHADPQRFKYVFHSFINSTDIAKEACIVTKDLIMSNDRYKKFNRAVLFSEDANWTIPLDAEYKKCLPKIGIDIVDAIRFSPNTDDFTPIFNQIESKKANLMMTAIAHVGVKPVTQWHQQQVPALMIGSNGQSSSADFWNATNGATNNVVGIGTPGMGGVAMTPKTPAFYKAYQAAFKTKEPAYSAYTTYDAMLTIFDALKRSGLKGGSKLVDAISATDIVGVSGRIKFHPLSSPNANEVIFSADPKKGQSFIGYQWQEGALKVVWPKSLATAEFRVPDMMLK